MVVGRVGRAHGVRGEVSVEVRTDAPERRFVPGAHFTTDPSGAGPLVLSTVRRHQDRLLLSFDTVADRTAAETLRGVLLLTDVAVVDTGADTGDSGTEDKDDDAWYDHELVGLRARLPDGSPVGEVVEVVHRPAQDALVLRRPGRPDVEVPFVQALVPTVDVHVGEVVVDPPEGLFDLDSLADDDGPQPG